MNKSTNSQLFPESLIWGNEDGQLITNSLMVAKYFGKRHDTVLLKISNLKCSTTFRLHNFMESSYLNKQKKSQPMYQITRDGFAFLGMGFTGQKAAYWKEQFINAFNQMETQIHEQHRREADALYYLKPHWRLISDGLANNLSRKEICELTGHRSPQSITANKRRMRDVGMLDVSDVVRGLRQGNYGIGREIAERLHTEIQS